MTFTKTESQVATLAQVLGDASTTPNGYANIYPYVQDCLSSSNSDGNLTILPGVASGLRCGRTLLWRRRP